MELFIFKKKKDQYSLLKGKNHRVLLKVKLYLELNA